LKITGIISPFLPVEKWTFTRGKNGFGAFCGFLAQHAVGNLLFFGGFRLGQFERQMQYLS